MFSSIVLVIGVIYIMGPCSELSGDNDASAPYCLLFSIFSNDLSSCNLHHRNRNGFLSRLFVARTSYI